MMSLLLGVVALAKPRIVALLALTGAAGAWREAGGSPEAATLLTVVVAGSLAAAGANAINQGLDADIDAVMRRTQGRPVPARQMSRGSALGIGCALTVAAVGLMGAGANALAAALTFCAAAVYVVVYTMLLKRRSWNNIVIGGAAGAFPPLIGSAAVSSEITVTGVYMFALIFFWTPPHFWTLSMLLREDYASVGAPMLAAVASQRDTARQAALYIALLTAMAWLPFAAGYGGWLFALVATGLGLHWLRLTRPLLGEAPSRAAMLSAYKHSLLYLAVAFVALAAEATLGWGSRG